MQVVMKCEGNQVYILLMPDSQGDIKFWDLMEWAQRGKILEKGNEIETLDFSHDGKIFATAGKVIFFQQVMVMQCLPTVV